MAESAVRLWDVISQRQIRVLHSPEGEPPREYRRVRFVGHGQWVVALGETREGRERPSVVDCWDTTSGNCPDEFLSCGRAIGNADHAWVVEVCPDNPWLVLASCGTSQIKLLDIRHNSARPAVTLPARVLSVCWLADYRAFVGLDNGSAVVVDLGNGRAELVLDCAVDDPTYHPGRNEPGNPLDAQYRRVRAVCAIGNILLTGTGFGVLQVWDADSGRELDRCRAHGTWLEHIRVFPGASSEVITVANTGHTIAWNLSNDRLELVSGTKWSADHPDAHWNEVHEQTPNPGVGFAFSPDGGAFACSNLNRMTLGTPPEVRLSRPSESDTVGSPVAFYDSGLWLIGSRSLQLRSLPDLELVRKLELPDRVLPLGFSQNRRFLCLMSYGNADGSSDLSVLALETGHTTPPLNMRFSPQLACPSDDGEQMLMGHVRDGSVELMDSRTGRAVSEVRCGDLTPESNGRLLAVGFDGRDPYLCAGVSQPSGARRPTAFHAITGEQSADPTPGGLFASLQYDALRERELLIALAAPLAFQAIVSNGCTPDLQHHLLDSVQQALVSPDGQWVAMATTGNRLLIYRSTGRADES